MCVVLTANHRDLSAILWADLDNLHGAIRSFSQFIHFIPQKFLKSVH